MYQADSALLYTALEGSVSINMQAKDDIDGLQKTATQETT
jgi:hypothetical protein